MLLAIVDVGTGAIEARLLTLQLPCRTVTLGVSLFLAMGTGDICENRTGADVMVVDVCWLLSGLAAP